MEFTEVINNGDSLTYETRMDLKQRKTATQAAETSALFLFLLYLILAIYQLKAHQGETIATQWKFGAS